ncbi:LytR/AlgR family response regulator transcription factor [Mucilaginibacter terrae]|uniref:Two-component system LytT family response regulator n=1 Tax=Mucilaginibacter terrae TaxID=1955052 RepID=A0ABU3GWH7_9SPHI|nr:LytTR family DNA-binding domain-containing protein [Mucilaginibacter terrae]MDT3404123.1 two-component system LytT family response regulator [Mucilaginibacter terrae]
MINAIAIDDEPFALEVIRSHAAKVPFMELKACFTNAFEAIAYLAQNPVDLLFLDIKMPDISGIELVESLQQKPLVIFTTAYAEHAVQSYELNAVDYLLKPFSLARFLKACHKANDVLQLRQGKKQPVNNIFVKSGYESVRVNFEDILFLEAAGNYVTFVLADDKRVMSRLTISEALDMLPTEQFARVHRSFIVNKHKIDRMERHQVHIGGNVVPVSGNISTETKF